MNTINSSNFPPEYQNLLKHMEERYSIYLQNLGESLIAEKEASLLKSLQKNKKEFDEMRAGVQEVWGDFPEILTEQLAHIDRMEKDAFERALSAYGVMSKNITNITTRSINDIFNK